MSRHLSLFSTPFIVDTLASEEGMAQLRRSISEPSIRPKTGMIVLFPTWLQHSVRFFQGTGTRVSVAINLVPVMEKHP